MKIILKEGQELLDIQGNTLLSESGDFISSGEKLQETIFDNEKAEIIMGFLRGALFTGTDTNNPESGGEPLEDNFTLEDFCVESKEKAKNIVECFLKKIGDIDVEVEGKDFDDLGIDLWMTMTHQGVGFWDGSWGDIGDTLDAYAKEVTKEFYIEGAWDTDEGEVEIY